MGVKRGVIIYIYVGRERQIDRKRERERERKRKIERGKERGGDDPMYNYDLLNEFIEDALGMSNKLEIEYKQIDRQIDR